MTSATGRLRTVPQYIAVRYGSGFIRKAFVVVVSALIVKTFTDAYL